MTLFVFRGGKSHEWTFYDPAKLKLMSAVAGVRTERRQRIAAPGFKELTIVLLIAVMVGAGIFVTAWRGFAVIDLGYQVRGLEKDEAREARLNRELEIERAMLNRPERIERIARQRMGMIEPGPGQIVMILQKVITAPAEGRTNR